MEHQWHRITPGDMAVGTVTTVVAEGRALCVARTETGYGVLDNRCPHQGGPLGDGHIENGYVICPWHGYEYCPHDGTPPPGFRDAATAYPVEEREDGLYVQLPVIEPSPSLMDQVVETLCDWGLDTVFGMVGHSNLGLADAVRRAEAAGRLRFFGIRHEGAAAFAASAYGKLMGRPAACLTIAGPGATNLLTGLWDAKVDRAPIVALTGQVQTQVLGPGAFQEVPLAQAFEAVAEWSQTVLTPSNATELAALAMKHALVNRDVAHLIFPDDVQELPAAEKPAPRPMAGRVADTRIAPPEEPLATAIQMLSTAERPVIIAGNGARAFREQVLAFAEQIDAPVITTFKAKGLVPDAHPLACGVLGRSGTPVGSAIMAKSDCLLVLGASFSNHTGIATWVPTIQVDADPMMLGKFHPVTVPLWGDIGRTIALLRAAVPDQKRPDRRVEVAARSRAWDDEKTRRESLPDPHGRIHPAAIFRALSAVTPEDAALAVDVGNNAYAFGHYFVCPRGTDVLMSGYLGSIGFGFPAAIGAWAATRGARKIIAVTGDGGFGQYLADFTTAVKYRMPILHVLLDNGELGKISREQVSAIREVWATDLVNPDFAAFAKSCGGAGFHVERPDQLLPTLQAAAEIEDRPALVSIRSSAQAV